ncbi:hypothetical protein [Lysobacter brunescens]|uniref:Secreted protein n=1 Tax=Lysobacter brunescens TaxID=262323 RepID=A0ABW2YGL2_9GAMM
MKASLRIPFVRRVLLTGTFAAVLSASAAALAYWPWETITVTSHYDANGALVGVEAVGACGFPLVGERGATSSQQTYTCDDLDEIPLPF